MLMPVQLTLYVKEGCSLCDDMERSLSDYRAELDFDARRVAINGNDALEARYGERVPVLSRGDEEICHYFLDLAALKRACG
jgi:hypothetical protein